MSGNENSHEEGMEEEQRGGSWFLCVASSSLCSLRFLLFKSTVLSLCSLRFLLFDLIPGSFDAVPGCG